MCCVFIVSDANKHSNHTHTHSHAHGRTDKSEPTKTINCTNEHECHSIDFIFKANGYLIDKMDASERYELLRSYCNIVVVVVFVFSLGRNARLLLFYILPLPTVVSNIICCDSF